METSELFRKTAKALIDKMPKGTQVRIADELGISRTYMNDFLNGRKMISESKREEIAEKLGYSYIDFLILGREMFKEKSDSELSQITNDNLLNVAASFLVHAICIFEESIVTMFKPDMSINLSFKAKAKIIINIYENFMKRVCKNIIVIDRNNFIKALELFDNDESNAIFEQVYSEVGSESAIELKSQMIAFAYMNPEEAATFFEDNEKINPMDDEKEIREIPESVYTSPKEFENILKQAGKEFENILSSCKTHEGNKDERLEMLKYIGIIKESRIKNRHQSATRGK